jgi:transcriptional regulator with XRE-family HTH domain
MKLNAFLAANHMTMASFASAVGTTTATISRIADGLVMPRKSLLVRIHRETGGLVTPNDLAGL